MRILQYHRYYSVSDYWPDTVKTGFSDIFKHRIFSQAYKIKPPMRWQNTYMMASIIILNRKPNIPKINELIKVTKKE